MGNYDIAYYISGVKLPSSHLECLPSKTLVNQTFSRKALSQPCVPSVLLHHIALIPGRPVKKPIRYQKGEQQRVTTHNMKNQSVQNRRITRKILEILTSLLVGSTDRAFCKSCLQRSKSPFKR
jgi:hypothetical protein